MDQKYWFKRYYKGEDLLPPLITCNTCSKDFEGFDRVIEFVRHLRFVHYIIELDHHPRRKVLKEKYIIMRKEGHGKCKR